MLEDAGVGYVGLSSWACLSQGEPHLKRGRGRNLEKSLLRGMPGLERKQHFYVPAGQTVSVYFFENELPISTGVLSIRT